MKNEWVKICNIGEISLEDVIRFDYKNKIIKINDLNISDYNLKG